MFDKCLRTRIQLLHLTEKGNNMDYLKLAQDHAVMVAYSTKGNEYTFDEIGLEYFLDSLGVDTVALKALKEKENV